MVYLRGRSKLMVGVHNMMIGMASGTLTLMAEIFNASGTFTMPSGVVNNEVIVACTGGGGGGDGDFSQAGGGSGRTSTTLTLSSGSNTAVTVASGGAIGSNGGTSSFGGFLSCGGGLSGTSSPKAFGASGGGTGVQNAVPDASNSSNCPAVLSLTAGAVDTTGGLYSAKAYASGGILGGGGGCYGAGGNYNAYPAGNAANNTGAGGGTYGNGGSGKVIVFYYKYV